MPGIKNPILVAKLLVQEQQKGLLPLGRVPPGSLPFVIILGEMVNFLKVNMSKTSAILCSVWLFGNFLFFID